MAKENQKDAAPKRTRAKDPNSFDQVVQSLPLGESASKSVRLPPTSTVEVIDDTVTRIRTLMGNTAARARRANGRAYETSAGHYLTRDNMVVVTGEVTAVADGD